MTSLGNHLLVALFRFGTTVTIQIRVMPPKPLQPIRSLIPQASTHNVLLMPKEMPLLLECVVTTNNHLLVQSPLRRIITKMQSVLYQQKSMQQVPHPMKKK